MVRGHKQTRKDVHGFLRCAEREKRGGDSRAGLSPAHMTARRRGRVLCKNLTDKSWTGLRGVIEAERG
jgi:hypothetical protein